MKEKAFNDMFHMVRERSSATAGTVFNGEQEKPLQRVDAADRLS